MRIGKRKPLSDITNDFEITDTHTLRKLVESTPRSAQKIAKAILKANGGSATEKFCSESVTGFGTSIRSSNVGAPRNTRAVQSRPPPRADAPATVSQCGTRTTPYNTRDSIKKLDKEIESDHADDTGAATPYKNRHSIMKYDKERKADRVDVPTTRLCHTRHSIKKLDKGREANPVIDSPKGTQLRKDKGGAGAVPLNASPTEKTKYNEPKTVNPKCLHERKNEATAEKLSVPLGISIGKPHKGKAILDFSSEWPSCSYTKDRMEEILNPPTSTILKRKVVENEFANSSSLLDNRIKGNRKPLISSDSTTHEKAKEKAVGIFQPTSIVKEAKLKGSRATVAVKRQSARRKTESRKTSYTKYSSYPPLTKTKSNFSDLTEPGDQEDLKSWTEPCKRARKKGASKVNDATELPQEWIDKWRAHFKEVDEFPLEIEEASSDELD